MARRRFYQALVALYLVLRTVRSDPREPNALFGVGSVRQNKSFPHRSSCILGANTARRIPWIRGGSSRPLHGAFASNRDEAYYQLARAIQDRVVLDKGDDGDDDPQQRRQLLPEIPKLVKALKSLAATQKSFKLLDGAAHEAYQRTHHSKGENDSKNDHSILDVKGRAQRSAARLAATSLALGACELIELLIDPTVSNNHCMVNGTLADREILLNVTIPNALGTANGDVRLLVLYEAAYTGPAGEWHGTTTIDSSDSTDASSRHGQVRGRLLVIVADTVDIGASLRLLQAPPRVVRLGKGPEVASVQRTLHDSPFYGRIPTRAVHICGYSLSAGVAATTAGILQGELPLHGDNKKRKRRSKISKAIKTTATQYLSKNSNSTSGEVEEKEESPLQGLFRRKVSAIAVAGPPCFSANVGASYITSMLYGDDIICRTSPDSLERFLDRTRRALQHSGFIGKRLNWLTDTASLAINNLQSHARGSEGEEARLTIPGGAYLVRPRRLGGLCSIHEVFGKQLANRRDALRASMLWQLNDILLSRSCWRHHALESYIKGLDRVQLRGIVAGDDADDNHGDDD